MLSCKEVTRLVSESQERSLTFKEKFSLKLHLMMCKGCRNLESSMTSLRGLMQQFAANKDSETENSQTEKTPDKH